MVNQYPLPREKRETPELVGNGGATYGPFGFKIFDVADVVVEIKRPGAVWQQETVVVAKLSGAAFDYFTISFAEVIGADVEFRVKGKRLHERSTDLTRGGTIIVDEMEKEASKQGVVLQEVRRDLDALPSLRDEVSAAVNAAAGKALEAGLQATAAQVAQLSAVDAKDAAVVAQEQAEGAAAAATAIAGFDPNSKLDKAGGTVTGDLTVNGVITAGLSSNAVYLTPRGRDTIWQSG